MVLSRVCLPVPAASCLSGSLESCAVRHSAVTAAAAVLGAVVLAGCGSQGVASPTPKTVVGSLPTPTAEPETPAFKLKGDPTAGAKVFGSAGCTGCHTLAAAKSTGTVGPNLDQAKPDYRLVTARVTLGQGAMPSF